MNQPTRTDPVTMKSRTAEAENVDLNAKEQLANIDRERLRHLISYFAVRFVNRKDAYYRQQLDGRYLAVYEPVTLRLIEQHLKHYGLTISVPALDTDNFGKWICFDGDSENGALDRLQLFLRQHGWHCIREAKRPGKAGHLWLLFDAPIAGEYLYNLSRAMVRLAGVPTFKLDVFPIQKTIGKIGSAVRLPLGRHLKPEAHGAIGWFQVPPKDVIQQLEWFAQQPLNSAFDAVELAREYKPILRQRRIEPHVSYNGPKRITFEEAIVKTQAKHGSGGWWRGHCPTPAHEHGDRHPSLVINCADDGGAIVKCFGGCSAREIYECLR
jgi:hypothetical protein